MPKYTIEVDVDNKGAVQSFKQVGSALADVDKAASKTASPSGGLGSMFKSFVDVKAGIDVFVGAATGAVGKLNEMAQAGNKQLLAMEAFSRQAPQAAQWLDDMAEAADGLADSDDIAAESLKVMQSGMISTAADARKLADLGSILGRAFGMDAAGGIGAFSDMLSMVGSERGLRQFGLDTSAVMKQFNAEMKSGVSEAMAWKDAVFAAATTGAEKFRGSIIETGTEIDKFNAGFAALKGDIEKGVAGTVNIAFSSGGKIFASFGALSNYWFGGPESGGSWANLNKNNPAAQAGAMGISPEQYRQITLANQSLQGNAAGGLAPGIKMPFGAIPGLAPTPEQARARSAEANRGTLAVAGSNQLFMQWAGMVVDTIGDVTNAVRQSVSAVAVSNAMQRQFAGGLGGALGQRREGMAAGLLTTRGVGAARAGAVMNIQTQVDQMAIDSYNVAIGATDAKSLALQRSSDAMYKAIANGSMTMVEAANKARILADGLAAGTIKADNLGKVMYDLGLNTIESRTYQNKVGVGYGEEEFGPKGGMVNKGQAGPGGKISDLTRGAANRGGVTPTATAQTGVEQALARVTQAAEVSKSKVENVGGGFIAAGIGALAGSMVMVNALVPVHSSTAAIASKLNDAVNSINALKGQVIDIVVNYRETGNPPRVNPPGLRSGYSPTLTRD